MALDTTEDRGSQCSLGYCRLKQCEVLRVIFADL